MDSPRHPPPPRPPSFASSTASNGGDRHHLPQPLEIRLFYVRVAPCVADAVPARLALSVNGAAAIPLRLDRAAAGEATYVSTGAARVAFPSSPFDVADDQGRLILSGAISAGSKWAMDAFVISDVFAQGGAPSPSFEVYVAGCVGTTPLILTQTVQYSPRRNQGRVGVTLDAIPEGEEAAGASGTAAVMENGYGEDGPAPQLLLLNGQDEDEVGDEDNELKVGQSHYPEGWYADDEDGQLSWFNAGVRVGVGIGLGMCVGIGIGVGLLMRSYQATTRTFKRRFL